MPELPDVTVYVEALTARLVGRVLERVRVVSPFVLRTFDPPVEACEGRSVLGVERFGKRVVLGLEDGLFIVLHLMIAGRLLWKERGVQPSRKIDLAMFEFEHGTLVFTEAGTTKRAALQVVEGRAALAALDPGGLDIFAADEAAFAAALRRSNRTLKRALTDPRTFSGIGNSYSDEILHAARLSPFKTTQALDDGEIARLRDAARSTLARWTDELRREFAGRFPAVGQITAFRPGFAVHGRFGQPCPACGARVQRVVYAEKNEMNYCPGCQTGGKILADRSLSRLLKSDWPKTVEELEGA